MNLQRLLKLNLSHLLRYVSHRTLQSWFLTHISSRRHRHRWRRQYPLLPRPLLRLPLLRFRKRVRAFALLHSMSKLTTLVILEHFGLTLAVIVMTLRRRMNWLSVREIGSLRSRPQVKTGGRAKIRMATLVSSQVKLTFNAQMPPD